MTSSILVAITCRIQNKQVLGVGFARTFQRIEILVILQSLAIIFIILLQLQYIGVLPGGLSVRGLPKYSKWSKSPNYDAFGPTGLWSGAGGCRYTPGKLQHKTSKTHSNELNQADEDHTLKHTQIG